MHTLRHSLCACFLLLSPFHALLPRAHAASFSGNARLEINDPTGALSWSPANDALTVQAWFKISVPSGVSITEDMTVLVNRRSGTTSDAHAYLVFFNIATGNIEFSTRGTGGAYTKTLIERPYLDRWYHLAVVRNGELFTAYVDGRLVFSEPTSVGNSASTDGVSIGGWGNAKYLYGEVQEVSIYQTALAQEVIVDNMFKEQPALTNVLRGYFKLAFSTNVADNLKNFAPPPIATNTDIAVKQGTGSVEFEETNQAGEQSYFDAQKSGVQGIVPLSGAFSLSQPVFSRPTPGVTFDLRFSYSSANSFGGFKLGGIDPYSAGPLGRGWRHVFETRILPAQTFSPLADTDTLGLMGWDGSIETWDADTTNNVPTGTYHTRSKTYRGELVISGSDCQWTTLERLIYVFRRPNTGPAVMRGRLTSIRDFNGNSVQINYDEVIGQISRVTDTAGGRYDFFHTNGLLRQITFGDWSINLGYDSTNRLVSKTITNSSGLYAPVNTTWQFAYNTSNGLMERVIGPRGYTNVSVVYDKYGRRIEQRDALGRLARTEFDTPAKRQIKNTDAETNVWIETFDRQHRLLSRKDPLGNETKSGYDAAGNLTTITEPLGWKTFMAYDSRANVTNIVDALGNISRRVIHPVFNKGIKEIDPLGWTNMIVIDDATGNLLRNYDALGDLSRYTYRSNGLVETSTDGNGRITRVAYDTNGFPIAQTDAGSNTTYFGVNELGWRMAQTNALGEVTTFTYDLNGKVVRTMDALQRVTVSTYDFNGNLLSVSDAKGQLTTYSYDAANQRTQMVDRAGNGWRYTYTLRGQISTTTDPLGFTSTNFYDAGSRLVATSDALGNTVSNIYDANSKVTVMIDQVGQRWTKTYDSLGRVIAETDPQGDTRRTSFDAANRVKQITTPNGYPSMHEYDGRARLTKWTDAEGFVWFYQYDGIQNITNITDALGGHYVMAYGPRNERILERNQDGFEWRYEYDELLRLKRQTDPNGISRTLDYDGGGRVLSVTFNTGRVNAFQYDDNNNPEVLSRAGSGAPTITSFTYDPLDRVIETSDAFNKKVRFGYDPRGLRATLTYPDGKVLTNRYDAIGRLTNQTDWAGRQMSYAFDRAGRLVRRTYPNAVVQSNTFDISGQLTSLNYAPPTVSSNSINIALQYAYDRNGNKVGSSEKGTLRWDLPSLTDEKARYTPANRLIDRQITPLPPLNYQPSTLNYAYDPSGNMTNAAGGGQSWRLTYDEDNRTTSIFWQMPPLMDKLVTNRYDALGRRVARKMDGLETRYVLDLAGGMERILCDMNSAGAITAWYVHGPDLAYKVDTTNGLTCYHADATANIIALSDGSANTTAQYAYTPYGRVLGSTNSQSQISNPYLFVGSQGVMEELPGLYFMRARYYSADAAVFLSTDPVKKIGAGWQPSSYSYAGGNPLTSVDEDGESAVAALLVYYTEVRPLTKKANAVLKRVETVTGYYAGRVTGEDVAVEAYDSFVDITGKESVGGDFGKLALKSLARDNPARFLMQEGMKKLVGLLPGAEEAKALRSIWKIGHDLDEISYVLSQPDPGGTFLDGIYVPSRKDDLLNKLHIPHDSPGGLRLRGDVAAASDRAARYAGLRNLTQGAVGKLATQGISLAAPFIGGYVADAFGRILPKSVPPVVREALKAVVAKAVTSAVTAAAPYIGAAVGAVVGTVVAVAAGAAHAIAAVIVAIVGVPKPLVALLVVLAVAAGFQYFCYRRRRRCEETLFRT